MKSNGMKFGFVLVSVLIVSFNCNQLSAQDKVLFSGGVGFPETLNFGTRFQINQSQVGLSIGTFSASGGWLFDWKSLVSISGDYYYHFGGKSRYSDLHPWYARIGLDYLRIAWASSIENNIEAHLRFGRDLYFSKNIGMSLDIGLGCFLKNETGFRNPVPVFGMCLFFKL